MHATYTSEPKYSSIYSTMSHFRISTPPFFRKCTEWPPQITLTCSRSKISTCMLHTPLRSKFLSATLYDAPLSSYAPFLEMCTEWPQMTSISSRSKIPIYMLHTPPEGQTFVYNSFCDEQFSSYSLILEKMHQIILKWPWHVQGQRYTYAYYIYHQGPNFYPLQSYNEPFSS